MSELVVDEVLPRPETGERRGGVIWLVLAAALWGTSDVASAVIWRLADVSPLIIAFLRLAFAAPFLVGVAYSTTHRNPFRAPRHEMLLFGAMGVTAAAYQLSYFVAVSLAGVTLATVVTLCSSPLMVAFGSIFVFGEHPTRRVYAALALALPGLYVLVMGQGGGNGGTAPLAGIGLALSSGVAYSSFTILSKIATRRNTSGPQSMAVAFTIGALLLLPAALTSGGLRLELPIGVWLLTAYMGIVATGLAYNLFVRGLRSATATVATVVTMLEPAVAAMLAWLLLDERLSFIALCGVALLVMSVLVLSIVRRT